MRSDPLKKPKLDRIREAVVECIADCEKLKRKNELTKEGKGTYLMAKLIKEILED